MCRQFDVGQKGAVQTSFVKQLSAPSQLAEKGSGLRPFNKSMPKNGRKPRAVSPLPDVIGLPKKAAKSMDLPN